MRGVDCPEELKAKAALEHDLVMEYDVHFGTNESVRRLPTSKYLH